MHVINNIKLKSGLLKSLSYGDCFFTNNTNVLYIKIHSRIDDDAELLGANLNNGVVEDFPQDTRVFLVSCDVIAKE